MNCNNCGTYNNPGTPNCQRCGAPLNNVPNNQMGSNQPQMSMQQMMQPQQPVQQPMMQQQPQMNMQPMMQQQPVQQSMMQQQPQMNMQQQMVQPYNNEKKPFNKKLLAIPVVALILVGTFFLLKHFNIIGGSKNDINTAYVNKLFNVKNPIPYVKDGKYGFTDSEGKVIVEAKYDSYSTSFFDNFAIVKKGDTSVLINKKGEEIATNGLYSYKYEYDTDSLTFSFGGKLYNSDLKVLSGDKYVKELTPAGTYIWTSDSTVGLMDSKGKVIYSAPGSYAYVSNNSNADYNERYCVFHSDKYAIVNCKTGKEIYSQSKYITTASDNVFKISVESSSNYKYVFVHKDKIYFETTSGTMEYSNGYVSVYNDGNYTYYQVSNKKQLPSRPADFSASSSSINILYAGEDYIKQSCGSKVSITKGGKTVVPCEWNEISPLNIYLYTYLASKGKRYAVAYKDDGGYLINIKNGKVVKKFNSGTKRLGFDKNIFIYYDDVTTKEQVVYNILTGKSKTFTQDSKLYFGRTYVKESIDGNLNYYNSKFKQVSSGKE